MKVLVCGGRNYDNYLELSEYLDDLHEHSPISCIINGGALGADTLSGRWADTNQVNCIRVPAKWGKHGKSAGYKRNVEMLEYKPDIVVATKGGKGTDMMKDIATKAGITVKSVGETS